MSPNGGPATRRPPEARRGVDARLGVLVWLSAWVGAQVVAAVVVAASGNKDPLPIATLAVVLLSSWAVFAAGVWAVSRRTGSGDVRVDFGLRFKRTDLIGLPLGVVVQLLVVPAVYAPLRAFWPTTFSDDRLSENATDLVDSAGGAGIVILVVLVVAGAPLVEEIVYRGLLQQSITEGAGAIAGWLLTAAVFTLVHFRPVEYPGLAAFALIVGVAARAGRLGLPISIHVGFNATGIAMAIW